MRKGLYLSLPKGFTLIELLVVIAVLGVLAAGVFTAINPVKRIQQARDSQRKIALSQIAQALQSYMAINGHYPITTVGAPQANAGGGGWAADCWHPGTNWIPDGWLPSGDPNLGPFSSELKTFPHDPTGVCQWPYGDWGDGSGAATYAYASDGVSFALAVRLENHSDSDRAELKHYIFPWGDKDTATFTGPGSPYIYWIVSK